MKKFLILATVAAAFFVNYLIASAHAVSGNQLEARMTLRKLWEDHTSYTHAYIVSALAGLPDTKTVSERLLRNQQDIGDAIKPYYGDEAGDKLAYLLKQHVLIATKVAADAKAGKKTDLNRTRKAWSQNSKDIAIFLNHINPNLSEDDIESILQTHLDLIMQQVTARLHKDWRGDIEASGKNTEDMLKFADALADGMARQFPDKLASR